MLLRASCQLILLAEKELTIIPNCSRKQRQGVILKMRLSKKLAWLIKKPVYLLLSYIPAAVDSNMYHNTDLNYALEWGEGEGTPLYKSYRYMLPQRVGCFGSFWSENGRTLSPFWSGTGYSFLGNYRSVWT